ncbi:hypothetical protein [Costertonia aggregata]|uniref:Lipoprotein n=1 Tax=Costertonia aggregata TaxID=343403 RepID=A0A7H9ATK0_9FLAO|nr:hypothetical protein [Costertonia aggregata]QLG46784.1 hypothetical protein HYG79_15975 [Costertonia aggregata]
MKNCFIYIFSVVVLFYSCGSFKAEQRTSALTFPELGSIIKKKGMLWYGTSEQVGIPLWSEPMTVNIRQLPFNPDSYNTYAKYMSSAGKINSIAYNDSLPYKPKYLRLELVDKIRLTRALNSEPNEAVLSYLANDADYKIVTRMDFTVPETVMPTFELADNVVLIQDKFNKVQLVLIANGKEELVNFNEIQIFDFEYSSFCWGEDRYHRKRIENIVSDGSKCPKGTFVKPSKVKADKSYLKF